MTEGKAKILLIDLDDDLRSTRVQLLAAVGHSVETRPNCNTAKARNDEGSYDLVIVALRDQPSLPLAYCDELSRRKPSLPVLLLTGRGVFVPPGLPCHRLVAGVPPELIEKVAAMLAGSTHVREVPDRT